MCIPPQSASALIENKANNEIDEAILAAVWNEQSPLRGPMWDCDGQPVAVVYRGRWTAGSGPDFEGAMLALGEGGSKLVTGSVEMHLRCGDWYSHGHHLDHNYDRVILHVVLWPTEAKPVTRADGASVPTLVLADYITLPAGELLNSVRPVVSNLGTLSEEPCWQRTQGWPLEKLLGYIDLAGDSRLLAKAAIMEADLDVLGSADELFYRGLLDSLGYSANREPMRVLAAALPLRQLLALPLGRDAEERATLLESIFLGAAGLLPSQRPDLGALDYLSSQYAAEVEEMWRGHASLAGLSHEPVAQGWRVDRVRPSNNPARRLAAAARLLSRLLWEPGGMLAPFVRASQFTPPDRLPKMWTGLLTVPGDGYWASHADFGQPLKGSASEPASAALIGSSRAADIAVNILLPVLVVHAERDDLPALREAALDAYASFPKLEENRITRAMADEALGPRKVGAISGARRQQGLIHLYRLYCEARRCYECPISGLAPNTLG